MSAQYALNVRFTNRKNFLAHFEGRIRAYCLQTLQLRWTRTRASPRTPQHTQHIPGAALPPPSSSCDLKQTR